MPKTTDDALTRLTDHEANIRARNIQGSNEWHLALATLIVSCLAAESLIVIDLQSPDPFCDLTYAIRVVNQMLQDCVDRPDELFHVPYVLPVITGIE